MTTNNRHLINRDHPAVGKTLADIWYSNEFGESYPVVNDSTLGRQSIIIGEFFPCHGNLDGYRLDEKLQAFVPGEEPNEDPWEILSR